MTDLCEGDVNLCKEEHKNERDAIDSIYGFVNSPVRLRYENEDSDTFNVEIDAHFDEDITIFAQTDLNRKISGKTRTLAPLTARIKLPDDYPLRSPPIICELLKRTLWLNEFMCAQITERLLQLYDESGGTQILFIWFETIRHEFLSPGSTYFLLPNKIIDCNQLCSDRLEAIHRFNALMTSGADENERIFANSMNNSCNVCFTDCLVGRDCVQFKPCNHVSCVKCIQEYFTMHINAGTIGQLRCLETDCSSLPTEQQIQYVVDDEKLYARYEKLSLDRALDLMNDVVMCPRPSCNMAVIVKIPRTNSVDEEQGGRHVGTRALIGICHHCNFSFCTFCRKANHGINKCMMAEEEKERLLTIYEHGTGDQRQELEKLYGKRTVINLVDELKSMRLLKEASKPCPTCHTNIEKTDGCNKMTCAHCHSNFCWLCGQRINTKNPYNHFNDLRNNKCFNQLFFGVQVDVVDQE